MKKLLAIVLCIAMIASISVTAFAVPPDKSVIGTPLSNEPSGMPSSNNEVPHDHGNGNGDGNGDGNGTETTTKTVEKISLWPVAKQANHFYGALQKNDTMWKIVNLYNGFAEAFPKLIENNMMVQGAMYGMQGLFFMFKEAKFDPNTGELILPVVKDAKTGEKIVCDNNTINRLVSLIWNIIGSAYVGAYDGKLGNVNNGTIAGAIANAENNIPTVSAPAGWDSSSEQFVPSGQQVAPINVHG